MTVFALLAVTAVAVWPSQPVSAQGAVTPPDAAAALLEDERNTIEIVNTLGDSVVAVNVEVQGQMVNPLGEILPFLPEQFRDLIPPPHGAPRTRQSSGSGFVVDDRGGIITNYHVVRAALESDSVALREGGSISVVFLSLIHISEPTRRTPISYAVFCLKKK